eukprot:4703354-Amphidinium_carterae.1
MERLWDVLLRGRTIAVTLEGKATGWSPEVRGFDKQATHIVNNREGNHALQLTFTDVWAVGSAGNGVTWLSQVIAEFEKMCLRDGFMPK